MARVRKKTKETGSRPGGCWPGRDGVPQAHEKGEKVRLGVEEDMFVGVRN